jgi:putative transposase
MQLPKRIRLPHDAYASREHVFHLVLHAFPDTHPFRDQKLGDAIWAMVLAERDRPSAHLIAASLMPDHLHLLASPRERDIIAWMRGFKSYSTRVAWEFTGRKVLWQPSYFDRRIRDEAELDTVFGYILRNPDEAGFVDSTGDWPWRWGLVEED